MSVWSRNDSTADCWCARINVTSNAKSVLAPCAAVMAFAAFLPSSVFELHADYGNDGRNEQSRDAVLEECACKSSNY